MIKKKPANNLLLLANFVAGGLGFEPRLAESESAVLPLDDPPVASPEKAEARYKAQPAPICASRSFGVQSAVLPAVSQAWQGRWEARDRLRVALVRQSS